MSQLVMCQGNACHMPLADKSVHCVLTSPPYFGLRSYEGLEPTCWIGGLLQLNPFSQPVLIPGPQTWEALRDCAHVWSEERGAEAIRAEAQPRNTVTGQFGAKSARLLTTGRADVACQTSNINTAIQQASYGGAKLCTTGTTCQRCQAWRGCLGNEPDVPSFLWHLILVLREVRRCLRDDGTLWLNIGDTHSTNPGNGRGGETVQGGTPHRSGSNKTAQGYAAGALLGIPGLFHQAAIADGWVVRQACVWAKQACMPESVSGSRHEYARCMCVRGNRTLSGTQGYATQGHREQAGGLCLTPGTTPDPACTTCHGTGRLDTLVLRRALCTEMGNP